MFVPVRVLLLYSTVVLFWPRPLLAQHAAPTVQEVEAFAERARSEATTGDEVPLPENIFKELVAEATTDGCQDVDRSSFETHRVLLKPHLVGGLAVWGGGQCICSPTGNCGFWIYELKNGAYQAVLETDLVNLFGFLKSQTHGYPDLVVWTHESATDYEARLLRFNGEQYVLSGGWEEEYEYLDERDQGVRPKKPRITSHFSSKGAIPSKVEP